MLTTTLQANTMHSTTDNCPYCQGEGVLYINYNTVTDCQCAIYRKKQQKVYQLFKSARVPKRYQGKSLKNYDHARQPKAYKFALDYLTNWRENLKSGKSLFFVGDVGTGKSHLAYAILNGLIKRGVPGIAASVPDLMDDLRDFDDSGRIEALKEIDLLVLDDLGSQKNSEWVTERLFIILNARYSELKPTIITSNHRLEVLEKTSGWERIVDRIIEMCDIVLVNGESYRKSQRRRSDNG